MNGTGLPDPWDSRSRAHVRGLARLNLLIDDFDDLTPGEVEIAGIPLDSTAPASWDGGVVGDLTDLIGLSQ